jgi:general secretion pathway protein B
VLELRANGELELADMHVDIHVFSDVPAERFVFINMDKHREGSTLKEGPTVREITVDGVVLEYRGRKFMLPRE